MTTRHSARKQTTVPKLKAKPIKKGKKAGKTFVVTQAPEEDSDDSEGS